MREYTTVGASADEEPLGATGKVGDHLVHLVIQPTTVAPGSVVLKDGATTVYTYPGSADYPVGLPPFHVLLDLDSRSGAWTVTTGANVSVLASGDFT